MNYKLILIEGIDGSGKGVISKTLKKLAKEAGLKSFDLTEYIKKNKDFPEYDQIKEYDVVLSSEPTYGWIGQAIREEMIKENGRKYSALAVAQAYSLDRKVLYKRLITKALKDGKIVFNDRSVVSSLAYQPLQARAQGEYLELREIIELPGNKLSIKEFPPSHIIIAKVDPEKVIERLNLRSKKDNCIFEKIEFLKQLQLRYESDWLRGIFEKQGTKIIYLSTNTTLQDTINRTREVWERIIK